MGWGSAGNIVDTVIDGLINAGFGSSKSVMRAAVLPLIQSLQAVQELPADCGDLR